MTHQWNWRRQQVSPDDILSAAKTLTVGSSRYEIDVTSQMTTSGDYLQWARECLKGNLPVSWDAALCYAKRAVCREIDAFMHCNHFGTFLGKPYPQKIDMLSAVGVSIPSIVHELIIEPRNEVEHTYKTPTQEDAKHAVELAELFLAATQDERKHHAIIAIAWSITIREERGPTYERIEFRLDRANNPMLLIDVCAQEQAVMVLIPKDEEIRWCRLALFSPDQAIALVKMLRQHYTFEQTGSYSIRIDTCAWLAQLKKDIDL
jgi:hypothetical protein